MNPASQPVTCLAILVVYVVRDESDLAIVRLHLDRIERHTQVPYTLYATTHRTSPDAQAVIAGAPNVVIYDTAPTDARGNREHAYYLDAMAAQALADGASHIATFDQDSFPIADEWVDVLAGAMPETSGVAGVLRAENGDTVLPHPSGLMIRRDFFERFGPSFSPDSDMTREFRAFLRTTGQSSDTGIRIAYILWSQRLGWGELLRSNVRDEHFLIAGVYGDIVFHLGAGVRSSLFRADLKRSIAHRVSRPIERIPVRSARTRRWKQRMLDRVRSRANRRIAAVTHEADEKIRAWMLADSDQLMAFLRGGPPESSWPAWALARATVDRRHG